MIPRPLRLVASILPLLVTVLPTLTTPAAAQCPDACYPSPSGVNWYGGTVWDGTDARWEAVPGSTWTFDSGVGSSILGSDTGTKKAGLHDQMEGWTGVLVGGTWDWSNIQSLNDLPSPLTTCSCGIQDSVLVFIDQIAGDHGTDQDNWAASPWIDLAAGDLGKAGRIVTFDFYAELPLLNYVTMRIMVQWRVGASLSAWTDAGPFLHSGVPECTHPGAPAAIDLSWVIPSNADEMRIGLGVVNYCSLSTYCSNVSNFTPVYDNVRFGVYDTTDPDSDNDGIADSEEDGAPNGGDADGDAIADSQEQQVASFLDYAGADYITLAAVPQLSAYAVPDFALAGFRCVSAVAASSLPAGPAGISFPSDLVQFTAIGAITKMTMDIPQGGLTGRYFVYGPTVADTTDHWYEFDWDGATGMKIENGKMRLYIADGGRGDTDRTANGVISHLGGPGLEAGQANAGYSVVPNVLYEPGGSLTYEVMVKDGTGAPMSGKTVEITTPPAITAILCSCNFTNPLSAVTDADGIASFQIQAGGCIDPDSVGAAFDVQVDNTFVVAVGGVSPDVVDDSYLLPWQGWNPGGLCQTGLSDAVFHSQYFPTRTFNFCSDLDSDGRISMIDAILVTDAIDGSLSCP